jgi:hypothetical protein
MPIQSGPSCSHSHNRLIISTSLKDGTACRCPHILPKTDCLAWPVPDGHETQTSYVCVHLWNHSGYTSQARMATTTIHTNIPRFRNINSLPDQLALNISIRNKMFLLPALFLFVCLTWCLMLLACSWQLFCVLWLAAGFAGPIFL